ncbi:deubiquitinase OTUD6B [Lucilia sericata]|uniref:deubiquitinase OTUD6B n=1 Tax=Lucilia sericata TaxID=13632 RepID=UPI0018A87A0C|nr:deubiquitinase OTUD6B [Lucilia sericata]
MAEETTLENDINETINKLDKVSIEDIQSRHRKERKELQAKIQALKKNAPKSDKKKRKEVLEEIAKLESDLEKKQEQEILQAENEIKSEQATATQEEPANGNHHNETNNLEDDDESQQPQQRVTKAQKRRDKKAREARQREEEIKASADDALYAPKAVEARKLQMKLKERELALHNIPSDGDCLYNAIRHQLLQNGLATLTIKELRSETANYIQANKDSLIPYMTHPQSGDLLTDEEFQKYCDDVRNTPAWGGQIELKALSSILKVPIEVLQADGSPTVQGAEFGGSPLTITYHRHMYSLGEHYNSTIPLADAPKDDDNNENGGN